MENEDIRAKYHEVKNFLNDLEVEPGRYGDLYLNGGNNRYRIAFDFEANEPGWKVFKLRD